MPEITSIHNPKVQRLRLLMQKRAVRESDGQYVVEGVRLAEEAWLQEQLPVEVYFSDCLSERGLRLVENFKSKGITVISMAEDVLQRVSETETSQGILLVMPMPVLTAASRLDFVLVLDQIRDPGNAGTMLRSAAAAGVQRVIAAPETTDLFAPKVVRAGMGAHFRLDLQTLTWDEIARLCKDQPVALKLMIADAAAKKSLWQQDLRQPVALVIGNEADGVSAAARQYSDDSILIPMPGQFESLNAAVAAGILLFEVVRQRSQ
ncbi:MAG: RNA methyltransferase [Anaerolineaceae bacterium]